MSEAALVATLDGECLAQLQSWGPDELEEAARRVAELQRESGATFTALVDGRREERLLPLDLVPRIIDGDSWQRVADGVAQRSRALNAFLCDVYGGREGIRAGVIPSTVIAASPGHRDTGGVWSGDSPATVAGMDLLQDESGKWLVLEDNLRVPSGIGYALHGREVLHRALPQLAEVAGRHGVTGPDTVVEQLREALHAAAPSRLDATPTLALLSAGERDSAWFEHRMLAERLGVPVVTPDELTVDADGRVHATPGGGLAVPIDVVYRRMDEDELAAATTRDGGSALEALAGAARAGVLGIANALGTGVADDKAVYASVPAMIEFYLGEKPILDNVPTWLLSDDAARGDLLDRLDELVVKPVDGYGGRGVTFGATLTAEALSRLRARIEQAPERWVAQEPVAFTTHTTWAGSDVFEPRHVDLRTFTFCGTSTCTAPVALTRVAPPGSRVVNSSRGGGAKDTWLLPPVR